MSLNSKVTDGVPDSLSHSPVLFDYVYRDISDQTVFILYRHMIRKVKGDKK